MYPPSFAYVAPRTIEEALETLDEHGDEAKVLAGGQSLIPLLKLRFASPQILVDINRIEGLDTIEAVQGGIRIGALVRHKACEESDLLRERYRVLADAAPQISDPIVRNWGTVCGSLAHADPQGDWGSALLAVNAELEVSSRTGARTIPLTEFFQGPFTTALEPNELITAVRVPDPGTRSSGTYLKLERKVGDFATVAVAVHVSMANGKVGSAGIALTAVAPSNVRATSAEEAVVGSKLDDATIQQAAKLATDAAHPHDDQRGTAEYKRNVVRVFTERGLRTAAEAVRAA